jgi:survival-of-motor-neuron-related-splicing factor 30
MNIFTDCLSHFIPAVDFGATNDEQSADYTAKGTFTSHATSIQSSIAEAPDISAFQFQPVETKPAASPAAAASSQTTSNETTAAAATTNNEPEKKKKKKKKSESQPQTFELPNHLIPLDSDTPAQKLKKQRAAKSLKSKFRAKQKEVEATKKANDWKSFATKTKKKVGSSIFSTEEGVNARVGVVSGGGSRGMTEFAEGEKKRHKFA